MEHRMRLVRTGTLGTTIGATLFATWGAAYCKTPGVYPRLRTKPELGTTELFLFSVFSFSFFRSTDVRRRSSFTIRRSSFAVHRSSFIVCRSSFLVPRRRRRRVSIQFNSIPCQANSIPDVTAPGVGKFVIVNW